MTAPRGCAVAALLALTMMAAPARAADAARFPDGSADWTDTEKWIWRELIMLDRKDPTVTLTAFCPELRDECSTVRSRFLRDVLTEPPWRDAVPAAGVGLAHAHVTGDLRLSNAKLVRAFWMANSRFDGDVELLRTRTDSLISFTHTAFVGDVIADGLQSDSDVQFRSGTVLHNGISLNLARIGGQLDLTDATVDGTLQAQGLRVADVFLRWSREEGAARAVFQGLIALKFARVSNTLDLRSARLGDMDLTGVSIAGDLTLGTMPPTGSPQPTEWINGSGQPSMLNLQNAQVGNLASRESAWPQTGHVLLDGFSFAHVTGAVAQKGSLPDHRHDLDWWPRLDNGYSATPYTQLAAALNASGETGAARRVQYLERERIREAAWASRSYAAWAGLTAMRTFAGYGIGGYTFIVLVWVLAFALMAAVLLYSTVAAARVADRGALWCFGACLSRLLPVVEINKEFTDFFNDPDRKRLSLWQGFAFDIVGIVGWILGIILVAALSGLTRN